MDGESGLGAWDAEVSPVPRGRPWALTQAAPGVVGGMCPPAAPGWPLSRSSRCHSAPITLKTEMKCESDESGNAVPWFTALLVKQVVRGEGLSLCGPPVAV